MIVLPLLLLASPAGVWSECLPRATAEILDLTSGWERAAIEALAGPGSDGEDRTLVDYTAGGDCGLWHLDGCDLLDDPEVWHQLAVLYSDLSPRLQLRRWRSIVGPAVRLAPLPPATAAVLANGLGSAGLLRLGESCEWDVGCMEAIYATTPHREARWRAAMEVSSGIH